MFNLHLLVQSFVFAWHDFCSNSSSYHILSFLPRTIRDWNRHVSLHHFSPNCHLLIYRCSLSSRSIAHVIQPIPALTGLAHIELAHCRQNITEELQNISIVSQLVNQSINQTSFYCRHLYGVCI